MDHFIAQFWVVSVLPEKGEEFFYFWISESNIQREKFPKEFRVEKRLDFIEDEYSLFFLVDSIIFPKQILKLTEDSCLTLIEFVHL